MTRLSSLVHTRTPIELDAISIAITASNFLSPPITTITKSNGVHVWAWIRVTAEATFTIAARTLPRTAF